jgi:hypothetical protein
VEGTTASLIISALALIVAGIAVYLALRQTRASEATAKIEQSRRNEEIVQAERDQRDVIRDKWRRRLVKPKSNASAANFGPTGFGHSDTRTTGCLTMIRGGGKPA